MARLTGYIRRLDSGFLIIFAIACLAIWPFISRASLPQETDAELHIFRLAELSFLVRGGELYPRWAPNFYHGYGYPIFNYYAPLSYFVGLLFELLPGLDPVAGVKGVFVLSILLAAVGTYGFVRDNWGRREGYVATAVYIYAPYVQYIDPHARGVLAESFSLGLFPLALWVLDRLRRKPGAGRFITAVLLAAAVILSHNLMALLFFGILAAWAAWEWGSNKFESDMLQAANQQTNKLTNLKISTRANPHLVFAALFLGLLLAAFFWMPVFLERNAVNLNTLLGQGDNYDFRTHFLNWRELLALTPRLDWGATQPDFRFNLGVAQWLLGGLGLALLLGRRVQHGTRLAFFALAAGVLIFLMLPASTFLWEATPILPFFQFPWRLLGATSFMLAVLAGGGTAVLMEPSKLGGHSANTETPRKQRRRSVGAVILVALPLLAGLPLSQPAPWPDFGPVTRARVAEIEFKGRWIGTTSTADYVPAAVEIIPRPNNAIMADFYAGRPLDRVNRPTLPEGATAVSTEISPLHFRYEVFAPRDFMLRLFLFDFPGWTVRLDGEEVETELGRPEGFIVVPVPPGEHVVDVRFEDTLARTLAWAISGLALIITFIVGFRISDFGIKASAFSAQHSAFANSDYWVLGVVLTVTAVTLLILNPLGVLHQHSTGYVAEPAETAVFANFDGQIDLIGYDTSARQAKPGDTLQVNVYWKAQQPQDINYRVFVHVLAPDGFLSAQSDKLNPGDFPTRRWPVDKYVLDEHTIRLPMGLAPGFYTVTAGLWDNDSGQRLPVLAVDGTFVGDNFPLFTLEIK